MYIRLGTSVDMCVHRFMYLLWGTAAHSFGILGFPSRRWFTGMRVKVEGQARLWGSGFSFELQVSCPQHQTKKQGGHKELSFGEGFVELPEVDDQCAPQGARGRHGKPEEDEVLGIFILGLLWTLCKDVGNGTWGDQLTWQVPPGRPMGDEKWLRLQLQGKAVEICRGQEKVPVAGGRGVVHQELEEILGIFVPPPWAPVLVARKEAVQPRQIRHDEHVGFLRLCSLDLTGRSCNITAVRLFACVS